MRFAIFVDGPNLVGSLEKLGLRVEDYEAFYLYITGRAVEAWTGCIVGSGRPMAYLWRVFWYQIGHMDELQLDNRTLLDHLRGFFENNRELHRAYMAMAAREHPEAAGDELADAAWRLCLEEGRTWYERKRNALEGMKRFNYSVRRNTQFIEIIESGHWKVDLLRRQVTEKGVDTALAVDVVTLVDSYDVAVVLSADADMIPSLSYAKQQGKHVSVVDLVRGSPPPRRPRHGSSRLKSQADFVVPIYEAELLDQEIATPRPGWNGAG